MRQRHKKQSVITYSFWDALMQALFWSILAMLCFSASMQMMQDVFLQWVISGDAVRWICALVVFTAVLYEVGIRALPRFHALCGLVLAGIYAAVMHRYAAPRRIDLEDGACAFARQFLEKYNKHLKTSYTIWAGKEELLGMSLSLLMLVIMLSLLMLALILRKRLILLLCPFTVLSGEMFIGHVPQWNGLALFFVSILFILAGEEPVNGHRRKMLRAHMDGQSRRKGTLLIRWLPAAVPAIAAVLIPMAGTMFFEAPASHLMEINPQVRRFQQNIEQNMAGLTALFFDQREEDINNRSRNYTGREVMRVTAAQCPTGDVFLKGFCGSDYENGHWTFQQDRFAKACRQAGYTQEEAAQGLLQAEYSIFSEVTKNELYIDALLAAENDGQWTDDLAAEDDGQTADSFDGMTDYTIEYTGIRSKEAYLPYVLDISGSISSSRLQLSGDAMIRKPWGQNKMEIHAWKRKMGAGTYASILDAYPESDTEAARQTAVNGVNMEKLFRWYNAFVYDAYLGVPDQIDFLDHIYRWLPDLYGLADSDYINAYLDDNQYIYGYIAEMIKEVMGRDLDYNLNLDPVPEGMDALDYFIEESRQGYCVHFASAAALILRKIGIPARYASGYVAKQNTFRPSDFGYTAVVRDMHAHAWVEIYLNGIGWIPIDVTPSSGQDADAQTTAAGTETENTQTDADTQADQDTQTDEETQADEETQTDSDEQADKNESMAGSQSGMPKWLPAVLAAGSLLLLVFCLFLTGRAARVYYEKPVKDLKSGRYRRAVIRLNQRIYRRLGICGRIRRRSMTDGDYEKVLASVYPDIQEQDWKYYMCVVREAAFSGQELQESDAWFCYEIYEKLHRKNIIGSWVYNRLRP